LCFLFLWAENTLAKDKFAVTGVLHPYFDLMDEATRNFSNDTGIASIYRATQHFDQDKANHK
jgi:hypothetical protein